MSESADPGVDPHCPVCGSVVFFESLPCPGCSTELGFHPPSGSFRPVDQDASWQPCVNRPRRCNWLAEADEPSGKCLSCRLTRRRPPDDDEVALGKLATAAVDKRRLLVQLIDLGLPIEPYYDKEGGLAFDLVSSVGGKPVTIGHADGVITIDLAESLDAHREALRVRLGEPYRTMLGHFRHEIGHYFQPILLDEPGAAPGTGERWDECRALFGDERASYSDALDRHYRDGAPEGWIGEYISDYATMHPWEDFAETFAHYLHITGTLSTAAHAGVVLRAERIGGFDHGDVEPRVSYRHAGFDAVLADWRWLSLMFNRVNRSMGLRDLYPFGIVAPVAKKLAFVHRLVQRTR
ncbi:putative zinc-binding metallopeptidase [Herbiconiux sp.]|uniref:zinc-binding metallopeptidase family protein n=1 Tax=Herbiconiux sp. TaxID=1871186 RepID=UPI0025B7CD46|nr:putative zinc-binding metallopeptidase [Herbiconiux sp.]